MQIVMIYFLWSGPMIPTSKVKRGNNKSWYWQRNMRQLLIFCLLLTSFPFHAICFTGYSLSEALSNQVIQKLRQIVHFWLRVQYKTITSSVHDVKSLKFFDLLIRWFHKYFGTMNLQTLLLTLFTVHKNKPKLCNQVRSLDHFVVQNSEDFLCRIYKEVVCL